MSYLNEVFATKQDIVLSFPIVDLVQNSSKAGCKARCVSNDLYEMVAYSIRGNVENVVLLYPKAWNQE